MSCLLIEQDTLDHSLRKSREAGDQISRTDKRARRSAVVGGECATVVCTVPTRHHAVSIAATAAAGAVSIHGSKRGDDSFSTWTGRAQAGDSQHGEQMATCRGVLHDFAEAQFQARAPMATTRIISTLAAAQALHSRAIDGRGIHDLFHRTPFALAPLLSHSFGRNPRPLLAVVDDVRQIVPVLVIALVITISSAAAAGFCSGEWCCPERDLSGLPSPDSLECCTGFNCAEKEMSDAALPSTTWHAASDVIVGVSADIAGVAFRTELRQPIVRVAVTTRQRLASLSTLLI